MTIKSDETEAITEPRIRVEIRDGVIHIIAMSSRDVLRPRKEIISGDPDGENISSVSVHLIPVVLTTIDGYYSGSELDFVMKNN